MTKMVIQIFIYWHENVLKIIDKKSKIQTSILNTILISRILCIGTERNPKEYKLSLGGNLYSFFFFLKKSPISSEINNNSDTSYKIISKSK